MIKIRRGFVYVADLSTQPFTHPQERMVLVVQTDLLNGTHPATLVCPMTGRIVEGSKYLRVRLRRGDAGLDAEADVMIDLVRTINNKRFLRLVGDAPAARMKEVSDNLSIILGLSDDF